MDSVPMVSLFPKRANNCKHCSRAMEMLCLEKQWRRCTDPGFPSIINEGVMFHTSMAVPVCYKTEQHVFVPYACVFK